MAHKSPMRSFNYGKQTEENKPENKDKIREKIMENKRAVLQTINNISISADVREIFDGLSEHYDINGKNGFHLTRKP